MSGITTGPDAQSSSLRAPIWKQPARGRFLTPDVLELGGVERMRAWMQRKFPDAPLSRLTGMRVTDVGVGMATMAMPASPWWQTGAGVFTAGTLAFLADGPLGGAVLTAAGPRVGMTTAELAIDFLRAATVHSGWLIGRGRLIQSTPSQGLAEVFIEDSRGRLLAHGTSRAMFIAMSADRLPVEPEPVAEDDRPDPYEREPFGDVLDPDYWNTRDGMDVARDAIAGKIVPPLSNFTGIRNVAYARGETTSVMPTTKWLSNAGGVIYGGALALLADFSMSGAVLTLLPKGTSFAPLDFKINFLRPVLPGQGEVTATARVLHAGRTIAVVSCEINDPAGKPAALAVETTLILPGRPWTRPVSVADERIAEM